MAENNEIGVGLSRRGILIAATVFTTLPPIIALLILIDNPAVFRKGDALVDLAAMAFAAASVPWVIVAVLLQRAELALQREELRLQRLEVHNLVAETKRQAQLMSDQLIISTKDNLISEYRAFIQAEQERISELIDEITEAITDSACNEAGLDREKVGILRRYGDSHVRVELTEEDGTKHEIRVRYAEIAESLLDNPRLRRAYEFWKRCNKLSLGRWFRGYLPHAIAPLGALSVYKLAAFNNVAARGRKRN